MNALNAASRTTICTSLRAVFSVFTVDIGYNDYQSCIKGHTIRTKHKGVCKYKDGKYIEAQRLRFLEFLFYLGRKFSR